MTTDAIQATRGCNFRTITLTAGFAIYISSHRLHEVLFVVTISSLELTFVIRGLSGFAPQNSLGSSETPNFHRCSPDKNKEPLPTLPRSSWTASNREFATPIS